MLLAWRQVSRRCPKVENVVKSSKAFTSLANEHLLPLTTSAPKIKEAKAQRFFSSAPSNQELREKGFFDSDDLLLFDTIHEMQSRATFAFPQNELFGTFDEGKGSFEWMTYEEFEKQVSICRTALQDLGVTEYSKVGIISNNRWEWAAITTAAYSLNAVIVPMYEAQLPKDWLYIVNDSECMALFCATMDIYERVTEEVLPSAPSLKATLCLDAELGEPFAFKTIMEEASKLEETSICPPSADDLANLIYTSGTTGKPKGVELTHDNFVSNVNGVKNMVDDVHDFIRPTDRSLSFLPWAHSYGQTCELWMLMSHGGSLGLSRGIPSILEDLQLVKPTMLFSVPTLYKRVYDGVHNMMETASPTKQKLMRKALELGRKKNTQEGLGFLESLQFKALDSIVLNKIRGRFGGNMRLGFSGGAACPGEIIQFMDDIGIMICEGYGLTETSPIICMNSTDHRKVGTVGRPITNVNVAICSEDGKVLGTNEEGEICCYGPNVMKGYYRKEEETAEVISVAPDGKSRMFHTGDLGKLDDEGYLNITGRLKELYKLENGKYVCPTPVEEAICMSRFIMQSVLCGANREYNVAVVVPDWNAIRTELKIDESITEEDLVNDVNFKTLLDNEINFNCRKAKLKKYEIPQDWAVVAPFTAANNMLTPKMSIRRHMVIRTYEDVIARMYEGDVPPCTADGTHCEPEETQKVAAN